MNNSVQSTPQKAMRILWQRARMFAGALACMACVWGSCHAETREPALTSAQVEDDWLQQVHLRLGTLASEQRTRPELDALGGCDGVINGEFGFHTQLETDPWWQVDLAEVMPLDRLLVYNRCGAMAGRAARLRVLLSSNGTSFTAAYQHDGSVFHGFSDGKPLSVALTGTRAQYVRLQIPGREYFHLDEVQVLACGKNVALGKRATQSSISEWSSSDGRNPERAGVLKVTLQSGFRLAAALQRQGVDVAAPLAALNEVKDAPDPANDDAWKMLYLKARRAIRTMALANPLLDFEHILFVKRAPGLFPHMSDQYYGWWSRPGGGVCVLEHFRSALPKLRRLATDLPEGNCLRAELSYDGRKVLFAHCRNYPDVPNIRDKVAKENLPEDSFYHLYEMTVEEGRARRLTRGRYDDFDGRYLPDGSLLFLSTRKGAFLQCTKANTARTLDADLPDSYVRCGGDHYRPVPIFTLHAMDANGANLRPLSCFESFEYAPSLSNDGRVLYCRWDYIDRFNGHFFSTWSMNQDGSTAQLVYGNYTVRPQVKTEPTAIPGSNKLLFTASAHHSITGGSLVLLDHARGNEGDAPLTRLTPEVPFPETERNVETYYANPWPLSEDFYLVSWSNRKLPPHCRCDATHDNPVNAQGLYLYDRFGNLELLYRDPALSSMHPVPLRARPVPPSQPSMTATDSEQSGNFLVQDTHRGLAGVPAGTIKRLRVVGLAPKVQPEMNSPPLGVSREETGKYILGTVPVEEDGSSFFRVPSGIPFFFQALDAQGRAVQTMRSVTYVQPGQTLACVGCHEPRTDAPRSTLPPLAAQRAPSRITPDVPGTLPLRFESLVQPVLDANCVQCHSMESTKPAAAKLDLTARRAYATLLSYAGDDLKGLVLERDYSRPREGPSLNSRLLKHLRESEKHRTVKLREQDWRRLYAWMDTYGHTQGCFSEQQEKELLDWRRQNEHLFEPAGTQ